ncbi:MAG: sugar phosphate isomerase/epimerase [Cyclobacteriaceae bacterium]
MKKHWFFIAIPFLLFFLLSMLQVGQSKEKAANQLDWNIGVALYSFNRFPFVTTLEKAETTGVKFVEGFHFHKMGKDFGDKTMAALSPEEIQKVKNNLNKKDLTMKSMYVGGAKDKEGWKAFFDMAQTLNVQYLVCEPERKDWDMVDELAGNYGIKIALHQHSKEAGSIYWHPDSVLSAQKNHPNFKACGDLGHWARSGLDPIACLKKLEGQLLSIHLKDLDGNHQKAKDVMVGTGIIDFEKVVKELKRQNFNGEVYVECEHKMEDNLADVQEAVRYFEKLSKSTN